MPQAQGKKMKKFMIAFIASMTVLFAGSMNSVAPITSGAYAGVGYGFATSEAHGITSADFNNINLIAGYNFTENIAVEGRYLIGLEESVDTIYGKADGSIDTFALYLKPQFEVAQDVTVYGLFGYAWNSVEVNDASVSALDTDGFAYGAGAKAGLGNNLEAFFDYTVVYNDTFYGVDSTIDVVTVGLNYNF